MAEHNIESHIVELPNPELDKARELAKRKKEEFARSGMSVVDTLLQEVRDMELASRFTDNPVQELNSIAKPGISRGQTKKEAKKAQLERDLARVKNELVRAAADLENTILEIEASKVENEDTI